MNILGMIRISGTTTQNCFKRSANWRFGLKMEKNRFSLIHSKNLITDIIDKSINIPRGGNYLEKITARKELIYYVHLSGQILHQDS